MKYPYYKAICPYDKKPVLTNGNSSYFCPHCKKVLKPEELEWVKMEVKKEDSHEQK